MIIELKLSCINIGKANFMDKFPKKKFKKLLNANINIFQHMSKYIRHILILNTVTKKPCEKRACAISSFILHLTK